jgi:alkanesulfonate monooxygenase SsuD/methylene tetrahydromethanopterin reductase-like flavin-dependent oxidoreductase (luciferase family)
MIEREGVAEPIDLAIIGDEARVVEEVQQLRECGAAEVAIVPIPTGAPHDIERTIATQGHPTTRLEHRHR